MQENKESLKKCDFCFSLIAHLHGHCPVCNDTGFVKKQAKESLPLEENNYVDHFRKFTSPGDAIR